MQGLAVPFTEPDTRAGRPGPTDREVPTPTMYSLPPEIFRRAMGHRLFEDAEDAIAKLRRALVGEYEVSARAAKFHMAAVVMKLIDRPDLEQEFALGRDQAIVDAREQMSMRRPQTRRQKPAPPPHHPLRPAKPADQHKDKGKDGD